MRRNELLSEAHIKDAWRRYEAVPDSLKKVATQRVAALHAVERLVLDGHPLVGARGTIADQFRRSGTRGFGVRSLARWAAHVNGIDPQHWQAILVPAYAGRTVTAAIPAVAWDLFKADYLRLETPTATSCYDRLQRRATVEGWVLPSIQAFMGRLRREISPQALVLARQGERALKLMFPSQERDRSRFAALEAVNADGHKFDVFVRLPTGKIVRPVMVCVQDLYSGKLLSWRIAETESADLARLAFRDVIAHYGIMSDAWLDNGRGFASKMLTGGATNRFRFKIKNEDPTGMLVAMGVNIHWTTPYNGQAKPIERAWRDLCDRIAKHPAFAGAYCGNKPDSQPENYGSKAVPWTDFVRVVNEEIAAHNARPGRRSKTCNGRSFDAVFNESYANGIIRRATEEQLRQLLLMAELLFANARDGSVRLAGNRYWCEALAAYCGQRVMVRFDPDALQAPVQVYTVGNAYIGTADCIAAVGFADTQAARDHARAKGQHRRAARQQLDAERRMDVAKVAVELPSPQMEDTPSAKVIAPIFGRTRQPAELASTAPEVERGSARFQSLMERLAARNAKSET